MIKSIWSDYSNVPNGIPNSGTDTQYFLAFFLFWAFSLIALWFPVHKIRHLFTVKAYFVPAAGLAWGIIAGIFSSISNFATLIVNDPDFARFARKPKDALWSQLLTIPIGFACTSFIGIIVSSSSKVIFDTAVWNPLDVLKLFLKGASSGERFGVFIIAAAFTLAQLGTNIAANSVSAGTDMTALCPKYLNIRRGSYICAAVGLAMCPWNLLASSNSFTTYLSAYSVFLSSIAGPMICDYYAVRRGYLDLKQLYSAQPSSPYYYYYGWSIRGYTAYICGILINIVGFVGAIGVKVPIGADYIYRLNYATGFIVSASVYWILCKVFPVPATSDTWMEVGDQADRSFSVVYTESQDFDEERSAGGFEVGGEKEMGKEKGVPTNF